MAAAAYVHVAERLGQIGATANEFTAEMVLNLAKALEVLFGGTRDQVRAGLAQLGYAEAEVEGIFVPILVLRNELDVGHAKLSAHASTELQEIYGFLLDAPLAVKEAVIRAVNAAVLGQWVPPIPHAIADGDLARLLLSMKTGEEARRARVGNRPYLHLRFDESKGTAPSPAT